MDIYLSMHAHNLPPTLVLSLRFLVMTNGSSLALISLDPALTILHTDAMIIIDTSFCFCEFDSFICTLAYLGMRETTCGKIIPTPSSAAKSSGLQAAFQCLV